MERQLLLNEPGRPRKLPTWTLFFAVCAAGIGGTFQYGYNVSIINAPTEGNECKAETFFSEAAVVWVTSSRKAKKNQSVEGLLKLMQPMLE